MDSADFQEERLAHRIEVEVAVPEGGQQKALFAGGRVASRIETRKTSYWCRCETWRPTRPATRIVRYNWPTTASREDAICAEGVTGTMSP